MCRTGPRAIAGGRSRYSTGRRPIGRPAYFSGVDDGEAADGVAALMVSVCVSAMMCGVSCVTYVCVCDRSRVCAMDGRIMDEGSEAMGEATPHARLKSTLT